MLLHIQHGGLEIVLRDEETYTPRSADNVRQYGREIPLCDSPPFSSWHGITITGPGGRHSALLLGCGGPTTVHDHSAVARDLYVYVACGNAIGALRLPELAPAWVRAVDDATCFAVYLLPADAGLISHGELSVARLSLEGEVLWSAGGRDIFTGEFAVLADRVRAVDWDGTVYEFALNDGRSIAT